VDDAIVKASQKLRAVVATTDIALKKRLRDPEPSASLEGAHWHPVPVIFLRDKSKLEIEGIDREYI
jgi:rRNA-processing protein FCF1